MSKLFIRGGATTLALLVAVMLVQVPDASAQQSAKAEAKKSSEAAAKAGTVKLRDPFRPLLGGRDGEGEDMVLPPGNRGLVIARLTVKGVVNGPEGMIAVVEMQGRNRAYFLREGEEVYNGRVREITEDGVVFMEKTTDAFGSQYEREVNKQIPGSGANR